MEATQRISRPPCTASCRTQLTKRSSPDRPVPSIDLSVVNSGCGTNQPTAAGGGGGPCDCEPPHRPRSSARKTPQPGPGPGPGRHARTYGEHGPPVLAKPVRPAVPVSERAAPAMIVIRARERRIRSPHPHLIDQPQLRQSCVRGLQRQEYEPTGHGLARPSPACPLLSLLPRGHSDLGEPGGAGGCHGIPRACGRRAPVLYALAALSGVWMEPSVRCRCRRLVVWSGLWRHIHSLVVK